MVKNLNVKNLGKLVVFGNEIERLLRENGAQGEGIHDLYQSISHSLPDDIVKKFKSFTYFRNNTFHYNPDFKPNNTQLDSSIKDAKAIIVYLERLLNPTTFLGDLIEMIKGIASIGFAIFVLYILYKLFF